MNIFKKRENLKKKISLEKKIREREGWGQNVTDGFGHDQDSRLLFCKFQWLDLMNPLVYISANNNG